MYKLIFTITLLFVSSLLVSGQESAPSAIIYKAPQTSELIEFTPSDESFKVKFAGKPDISEAELPNNALMKVYKTSKSGSNSVITTVDFPFAVDREQMFNLFRENVLKSPKIEIKNERNFVQNGLEGKELEVLQDYYYLKYQVFLVENRIYELKSTVTNWHILSDAKKKEFFDETARFFNSFKPVIPQDTQINDSAELFGNIEGNLYSNKFLGLSLTFPKDWSYKSNEEMKAALERGLELYKTDNEKNNKEFSDSSKQEVMIFSVAANNKDRNFGIGVFKQPNQYVFSKTVAQRSKEMFLANENVQLLDDIKEININGTNYSAFSIISFDKIRSRIYLTMKKGYSVSLVLTFLSAEGEKELESMMKSVKFNK